MKNVMHLIDYARVEVRFAGQTYVVELEPDEHTLVEGHVEVDHEIRELDAAETGLLPWVVREPTGRSLASIQLKGPARRVEPAGARGDASSSTAPGTEPAAPWDRLAWMLEDAGRLLRERPVPGEVIASIEKRLVTARWLIAEVDLEVTRRKLAAGNQPGEAR